MADQQSKASLSPYEEEQFLLLEREEKRLRMLQAAVEMRGLRNSYINKELVHDC